MNDTALTFLAIIIAVPALALLAAFAIGWLEGIRAFYARHRGRR